MVPAASVFEFQHTARVDSPPALHIIGIGHADVLALVVGEVEVVFPQWSQCPDPYQDE